MLHDALVASKKVKNFKTSADVLLIELTVSATKEILGFPIKLMGASAASTASSSLDRTFDMSILLNVNYEPPPPPKRLWMGSCLLDGREITTINSHEESILSNE